MPRVIKTKPTPKIVKNLLTSDLESWRMRNVATNLVQTPSTIALQLIQLSFEGRVQIGVRMNSMQTRKSRGQSLPGC